jgi:hypothetical protein
LLRIVPVAVLTGTGRRKTNQIATKPMAKTVAVMM